jgi:hypothetical protein
MGSIDSHLHALLSIACIDITRLLHYVLQLAPCMEECMHVQLLPQVTVTKWPLCVLLLQLIIKR